MKEFFLQGFRDYLLQKCAKDLAGEMKRFGVTWDDLGRGLGSRNFGEALRRYSALEKVHPSTYREMHRDLTARLKKAPHDFRHKWEKQLLDFLKRPPRGY